MTNLIYNQIKPSEQKIDFKELLMFFNLYSEFFKVLMKIWFSF